MKKPIPSTSLSRRTFLKTTAMISAATAAGTSGSLIAAESSAVAQVRKKRTLGLELYSVRGELAKDLPGTLKTVASFGYEVVEFYSPYFKWKPAYTKEVREQLDDLGLRCYSTHNGFESFTPGDNLAHAIELNQILGARYIVLA